MRADLQRLKRDTDSGRSSSPVSTAHINAVSADSTSLMQAASGSGALRRKMWSVVAGVSAIIAVVAFVYAQSRPVLPPTVSGYVPITHDGNAKWLVGTDGARLYFGEFPASGQIFAQVSTSGGEVARVPAAAVTMSLLDVSPDGSTLLAADEIGATAFRGYLWEVAVFR